MAHARPSQLSSDFFFRAALAAAFGGAAAAFGYAWVRGLERILYAQPDPRAVVAVAQSGYLLRCGVAAFIGGMGLLAGWLLTATPSRAVRALRIAVWAAAIAIAVQTGLAP